MNHGFGNCDYGETWIAEGWLLDYNPEGGDQMAFWWELLWEDENFKTQVFQRYNELRSNLFSNAYINSIIDIIQESNSDCEIIVEIPAPGHSEIMQGTLADYFENLKTDLISIAETQTTEKSDVLTVNMHQGFTDEMLADKVHYNGIGAKFIAEKHYEVLKEIIQ